MSENRVVNGRSAAVSRRARSAREEKPAGEGVDIPCCHASRPLVPGMADQTNSDHHPFPPLITKRKRTFTVPKPIASSMIADTDETGDVR
ncbi:hypothetical protein [Natrinema soli]|uniref:Uncharacterized protein n=1 Tax=Natrinema soli TaxID=1930624 RepID=A0ABD5ST78_9EURY|nr:hypothetical protein [Natrinema soli]